MLSTTSSKMTTTPTSKTISKGLLVWGLLLPASLALAAPRSAPEEVLLWPGGAPGSEGKTAPEAVRPSDDGIRRIQSIHKPSVTVYLPARRAATGASAIIMPGGGHRYLSIDNEGHAVARWLAQHGVAGFVLKYRLAREDGSTYKVEEHAVKDAQRAIRVVRARAKSWNLDPQRVGVIGFSAGAQLASFVGAGFDAGNPQATDPVEKESSRPAFQALMYGGAKRDGAPIPKDAPPAFFLVAADDKNPSTTALELFPRFREAGIDAELHIFSKGGHGFGMKDRPLAITGWPARFREWLADQGLLKAAVPAGTLTTKVP
jgi:endo-1,4-beta-xylanase